MHIRKAVIKSKVKSAMNKHNRQENGKKSVADKKRNSQAHTKKVSSNKWEIDINNKVAIKCIIDIRSITDAKSTADKKYSKYK